MSRAERAFRSPLPSTADDSDASPFSRSEIMKTVADQFAETLATAGVKRIHGRRDHLP